LQNLAPAPSLPLVLKGKLFVRPTSSMEHCIDSVTTCRRGTCASNAEQSPRPASGKRAVVALRLQHVVQCCSTRHPHKHRCAQQRRAARNRTESARHL
jgi:hypothetical protein